VLQASQIEREDPLNIVEIVASIFGFFAVALTILRNPWCWPIGLVQVVLYISVFYEAKLYSDMLLHIVFVGLQFYGWGQWYQSQWHRSDPTVEHASREIRVECLSLRGSLAAISVCLVLSGFIGISMRMFTDAAWPFADAFIAGTSLVAQWLLAKRKLESWYLWIAVDIVAIVVFSAKGLIPTTCLYVLFLIMSIFGAIEWHRKWRATTGTAMLL